MMRVQIKPELKKFVAEKVRTGQDSDVSDLVNEALEVLRDQEDFTPDHAAYLGQELRRGAEQLDAGQTSSLTAEQIIAEERARRARDKDAR